MCELFGFSAAAPADILFPLQEFFSHSRSHPHGWGLALLDGSQVHIEKEPIRASDCPHLKKLLTGPLAAPTVLGHIRLATIGNIDWRNCHPYTIRDVSGRHWTLIHNGTIFDFPPMDRYYAFTDSDTDSACLLSYIVDQVNIAYRDQGHPLDADQRCFLLDGIFQALAPGNKVNLMLYDGELLYVHANYPNSLYCLPYGGGTMFSTKPLTGGAWDPVLQTRLLAYREGALCFTGTNHGAVYEEDPEQTRLLYLAYAAL